MTPRVPINNLMCCSFAGRKGATSTEQWAWRTQWEAGRGGWSHRSPGKIERHATLPCERLSQSSKIMSHIPWMNSIFQKNFENVQAWYIIMIIMNCGKGTLINNLDFFVWNWTSLRYSCAVTFKTFRYHGIEQTVKCRKIWLQGERKCFHFCFMTF